MFACLTTTKKQDEHIKPLVITDTSNTDTLHPMDKSNNPHQHAKQAVPPAINPIPAGFLNYPPCQGAPSPDTQGPFAEFSTPEKVEIQITTKSFTPVSYYTSKKPAAIKMEVEIETVSSNANHPGNTQLRDYEDANDNSDNNSDDKGPPSLLLPPPILPAKP